MFEIFLVSHSKIKDENLFDWRRQKNLWVAKRKLKQFERLFTLWAEFPPQRDDDIVLIIGHKLTRCSLEGLGR